MLDGLKQKAMASEIMDLLEYGPTTSILLAMILKQPLFLTLEVLEAMQYEGLIIKDKYSFWSLAKQEIIQKAN